MTSPDLWMSLVWTYTSPASLLPVFWTNNIPFSVKRWRTQFKMSGKGAYLLDAHLLLKFHKIRKK